MAWRVKAFLYDIGGHLVGTVAANMPNLTFVFNDESERLCHICIILEGL